MQYLKRLNLSLLYNKYHLIAIITTLGIATYYYRIVIIHLLFLLLILRKARIVIYVSSIITLVIICRLVILDTTLSTLEGNTFEGEVISVTKDSAIVKVEQENLLIYTDCKLIPGQKIKFMATLKNPSTTFDSKSFDYQAYLKRRGIYYIANAKNMEIISEGVSINKIRYKLCEYLDSIDIDISNNYLKPLILGERNDMDENIKEKLSLIGISHLFAISGLHITLLVSLIKKIEIKSINGVIVFFLTIYMIITGFTSSVVRASLMIILKILSDKLKLGISSLDIISIIFVALLLINPYYIMEVGFQLSFMVSFALILSTDITSGNYIKSTIKTTIIAQVITLPILVNLSNQINILSIFYNLLYIGFFTKVFLPFTFLMPFIKTVDVYKLLVDGLEKSLTVFSNVDLTILLPYFSVTTAIIYYTIIFLIFKAIDERKSIKKLIIVLAVFLIVIRGFGINKYQIYIFDVGQGDSSLITTPRNKTTVIIDCFNDIDSKIVNAKVYEIDCLIITHGHEDHIGSAKKILEKIPVKKIMISKYDNTELTMEIIKEYKSKITYISAGDTFNIDGLKIEFFGPIYKDDNVNNNSLITKITYRNTSALFMGDAEIKEIEDTIKKYGKKLKSDIIKIAHHGSRNAITRSLLEVVNPNIAIISVGRENSYNLPDREALEILQEYGITYHSTQKGNYYFCE